MGRQQALAAGRKRAQAARTRALPQRQQLQPLALEAPTRWNGVRHLQTARAYRRAGNSEATSGEEEEDEQDEEDWETGGSSEEDTQSDHEWAEYVQAFNASDALNELIDEFDKAEDTESYAPLKGNIYRLMFIGRVTFMRDTLALCGFLSVVVVQLTAPAAVLIWALYKIAWKELEVDFMTYRFGSEEFGVSHVLGRILAVALLYAFAVNGIVTIRTDHEMHIKLNMLIRYADRDEAKVRQIEKQLNWSWSALGVFVNATMPVLSTLAVFLLFIIAHDPKDIIFDSLGMTFLYTMDDIDGPLGLLSTKDWNEEQMGRFYFKMVNPVIKTPGQPYKANYVHKKKKYIRKYGNRLLWWGSAFQRFLAFVLPPLYFICDGVKIKDE